MNALSKRGILENIDCKRTKGYKTSRIPLFTMKLFAQRGKEPSLAFGGQALIEGVMMRSRTHVGMCIRQPNNEILTHTEKIKPISERYKVLGLPFLRGIVALLETLYLGVKGIYFSANAVLEEEEKFHVQGVCDSGRSGFNAGFFFLYSALSLDHSAQSNRIAFQRR